MNGSNIGLLENTVEVANEEIEGAGASESDYPQNQRLSWSIYNHLNNSPDPVYRISHLSALFGRENSFFVHLIERHKILVPARVKYGEREVYAFSECDIERIRRVLWLQSLGFKIGEIAEIMGDQDAYQQNADEVYDALGKWRDNPNNETWGTLVEAISESPILSFEERMVLRLVNKGYPHSEICRKLRFANEKQVSDALENAQSKLGKVMFRLFHHMGKKQQ